MLAGARGLDHGALARGAAAEDDEVERGSGLRHPPHPSKEPGGRPVRWGALLLLAALLAFGGVLANGFAWDDQGILVEDEGIRSLSGLKEVLFRGDTVWSTERNPYYRPFSRGAFVVEYALFGGTAPGYHAVSLALHIGNVLLLLAISRRILGGRDGADGGPAAYVAPLLLAVHPVSVEAVAFASTQNTLWAALFSQLAVLAALRGRLAASAGALFLGLLSKETAAMVVPLAAVAPSPAGPAGRSGALSRLRTAALLSLVLVPYLALRSHALADVVRVPGGGPGLGARLLSNLAVVPEYAAMLLVPWRMNAYRTLPPLGGSAGAVVGMVLGWSAVALLVLLAWRRAGALGRFGLAWAALEFLPAAGIVPIPSAPLAERYAYLPAMGVWLVLGGLAAERGARRRLAAAGLLFAAVVLGLLSARRTAVWRNDLSLFTATVAASPGAALPRFNLGNALLDRGDLAGARRQWQEAVRLDPGFSRAWNHLANAALLSGDAAAAEGLYRRALSARDSNPEAAYNLALLLDRQGRVDEALAEYGRFLASAPRETAPAASAARDRVRQLRALPKPP